MTDCNSLNTLSSYSREPKLSSADDSALMRSSAFEFRTRANLKCYNSFKRQERWFVTVSPHVFLGHFSGGSHALTLSWMRSMVSIVCICKYMYVYVSICMYIFICTYCTYMIVCVCICQRHKYRYMHIRAYTYNTYTYVHTYRICTMCKCTYWIVFLVEYVTYF